MSVIIVSQKHRKLVVPASCLQLFPDAQRFNGEQLLLDHNAANTIVLRHMGYKVPSPMRLYYDFPHPVDEPPFETQFATCEAMSENPRFYNLNDKGTGKTRTALWTWKYLHDTGMCGKLLVVAPLSTLHFTWMAEIFKIFGDKVKGVVLHGTAKQRRESLALDADIYIINHDGFKVISKEIEERKDIDTLCLDELAVYRNNSDRSKLMRKAAARFDIVWGMTGSPMPQEPTDVWGQAKIVKPNSVPKYRKINPRHAHGASCRSINGFLVLMLSSKLLPFCSQACALHWMTLQNSPKQFTETSMSNSARSRRKSMPKSKMSSLPASPIKPSPLSMLAWPLISCFKWQEAGYTHRTLPLSAWMLHLVWLR